MVATGGQHVQNRLFNNNFVFTVMHVLYRRSHLSEVFYPGSRARDVIFYRSVAHYSSNDEDQI